MTDRHLHVRCECSENLHFVAFDYLDWNKPNEFDLSVEVVGHRAGGFWKRLKWATIHLFGRDHLVRTDVVLSREKAKEIAAYLNEVAA